MAINVEMAMASLKALLRRLKSASSGMAKIA